MSDIAENWTEVINEIKEARRTGPQVYINGWRDACDAIIEAVISGGSGRSDGIVRETAADQRLPRFCWYCGESLGWIANAYYEPRDTCGKFECTREARDAEMAERDEAHKQLDRDRGWGRW